MSTRGCVAIGTEDKWKGVYNHFDSYPSGLGKKVFELIHRKASIGNIDKAINNIVKLVKDHPVGWSSFGEACYCHDRGETNENIITNETVYPGIEWIYIIDPKARTMTILEGKDEGYKNIEVINLEDSSLPLPKVFVEDD